jgi:hypothetical protein
MNLTEISFPVYKLPSKPEVEGTTIFISTLHTIKVLDDTSIDKPTLGLRRLQLVNPYPLTNAIYYIKDLLKFCNGTTWFIDNKGKTFIYKKSKSVPLVFKPITKIIPINTGGALLELNNENPRFKVLYRPSDIERYAGVLEISKKAYILYGLYDQLYDKTERRI